MVKPVQLWVALLASCLAATACGDVEGQQQQSPAEVTHLSQNALYSVRAAVRGAVVQGANTFNVEVMRQVDGTAAANLPISVSTWMPAHGHGGPGDAHVEDLGQGKYRVDNVVFSMSGTWEVRYQLGMSAEQDTATFTYNVP